MSNAKNKALAAGELVNFGQARQNVNNSGGSAGSTSTNYKGSIQQPLTDTWVDVKTKDGNVKAQVSDGWDDFKTRVSNARNDLDVALETTQSRISDTVRGTRTKIDQVSQEISSQLVFDMSPSLAFASGTGAPVRMQGLRPDIDGISFSRVSDQAGYSSSGGSRTITHPGKESFSSWDEVKIAHKGELTSQIHAKKPKGSPAIKKWFDQGGSIEIETLADGKQVWSYTSADGVTVPYVPREVNGKWVHTVEFPESSFYPGTARELNIGNFTGRRSKDIALAKDILMEDYGLVDVPQGYVLHHEADNGVMSLVDEDIHRLFKHYGGFTWFK